MYRVIAVAGAALALVGCSTNSDLSHLFKSEPQLETVRFESQPPGAQAATSVGQTCQTPCALALPGDKPFDVTFTLAGFQPAVEKVQLLPLGDGTSKLRPNPVLAELTPLAPPPKKKRAIHRRVTHRKPAAKPVPKAAHKPAPKPATPAPAAPPPPQPQTQQSPSPWPAAPPPPMPKQ